jgi:hypothetical protein
MNLSTVAPRLGEDALAVGIPAADDLSEIVGLDRFGERGESLDIADEEHHGSRADQGDGRTAEIFEVRRGRFLTPLAVVEFVIRESEDVAMLQLTRRGDARAVQITPIEATQVEEVESAVLLPDHRMPPRHPRIGDDDLTLGAASDDGDIRQSEGLLVFNALEVGVHAAR